MHNSVGSEVVDEWTVGSIAVDGIPSSAVAAAAKSVFILSVIEAMRIDRPAKSLRLLPRWWRRKMNLERFG